MTPSLFEVVIAFSSCHWDLTDARANSWQTNVVSAIKRAVRLLTRAAYWKHASCQAGMDRVGSARAGCGCEHDRFPVDCRVASREHSGSARAAIFVSDDRARLVVLTLSLSPWAVRSQRKEPKTAPCSVFSASGQWPTDHDRPGLVVADRAGVECRQRRSVIGTVAQVAEDKQDDIFDGLAVKAGSSMEISYVPGEQIGGILPGAK
jgi:hypothetical protein